MPLNKAEYEIGQLYGVAKLSGREAEAMQVKGESDDAGGNGVRGRISVTVTVEH